MLSQQVLAKRLQDLEAKGHRYLAKLHEAIDQGEALAQELSLAEARSEDLQKAREVLKKLADEVRRKLKIHMDSTVNAALVPVFGVGCRFDLQFIVQKDSVLGDLAVMRGETRLHPMDSRGGGVVDVTGFGSQIAAWTLKKTAPFLLLDQPFGDVSKQRRCGRMVKALAEGAVAEGAGIQVLMVLLPQQQRLIDEADRQIYLELEDDITRVVEADDEGSGRL